MKTNASDAVFYMAKVSTIDDVMMCKTKYLVYFIAIRSSVSRLLEENPIIDPFYAIQGQQLMFQKIKLCNRNKF